MVAFITLCVAGAYTGKATGTDARGVVTKPFKLSGSGEAGYFPFPGLPPTTYYSNGTATGLGKYHSEGEFQFDSVDFDTLTGTFSSGATPTVFTAANGDELHCDFAGTFAVMPQTDGSLVGVFIATFEPADGKSTGRFENSAGSFVMTATTAPFASFIDINVPFTWEADGYLDW